MAEKIIGRGSVVLIRYPFTDLSGFKMRPAVIVMPDDLLAVLDDVLCAFVTTMIPDKALPTDLIVSISSSDFAATGLKQTSMIRAHKLALLHKSLVHSHLGKLDNQSLEKLNTCLKIAVGLAH